jgi:FlaA1/EpsC-like NDP-sugar epimerase
MNKPLTVIYGAGEAGQKLFEELSDKVVIAFIDDDICSPIHNTPVFTLKDFFDSDLSDLNYEVILAIPSLNNNNKLTSIYEAFFQKGKKVSFIVNNRDLITKLPLRYQITDDIILKLLGRTNKTILGDSDLANLSGKSVLVLGAGGSIGSIISKFLSEVNLSALYCADTSELNIYNLKKLINYKTVNYLLLDVRDSEYLRELIDNLRPNIIINAAAYKHVNIVQQDLVGTFRNNVKAFCNLVDISKAADVSSFIQVSTDKAANPTTVMGASKLFAERYLASQNSNAFQTKIVRFGNVLGSSGSVLPSFIKQLYENNKLEVTHPGVERYFMSVPEAAQLVVKCITMKQSGIYILKMGAPKKILDMAVELANLSGRQKPAVEFTSLKQGEKLSETLTNQSEELLDINEEMYFCSMAPLNRAEDVSSDLKKVKSHHDVLSFLSKYVDFKY